MVGFNAALSAQKPSLRAMALVLACDAARAEKLGDEFLVIFQRIGQNTRDHTARMRETARHEVELWQNGMTQDLSDRMSSNYKRLFELRAKRLAEYAALYGLMAGAIAK